MIFWVLIVTTTIKEGYYVKANLFLIIEYNYRYAAEITVTFMSIWRIFFAEILKEATTP